MAVSHGQADHLNRPLGISSVSRAIRARMAVVKLTVPATIESTGSSTRIEGAASSDREIERLLSLRNLEARMLQCPVWRIFRTND